MLICTSAFPAEVHFEKLAPGDHSAAPRTRHPIFGALEWGTACVDDDDDSHSFIDARIPVITLHSLTQQTLSILHSTRDQLKAINTGHYYEAYRLAAAYLAYLDSRFN